MCGQAATDDAVACDRTQYGKVEDKVIIFDKATGQSCGYGFVSYATRAEADRAIEALGMQQLVLEGADSGLKVRSQHSTVYSLATPTSSAAWPQLLGLAAFAPIDACLALPSWPNPQDAIASQSCNHFQTSFLPPRLAIARFCSSAAAHCRCASPRTAWASRPAMAVPTTPASISPAPQRRPPKRPSTIYSAHTARFEPLPAAA